MRTSMRLHATLLALMLVAAACGDASTDTTAATGTTAAPATTVPPGTTADPNMEPVRVGLISQEKELLAFPEISAMARTLETYVNSELGGVDGHPLEFDICLAGDAPESSVACAQQFVNDPTILTMIVGSFSSDPAHAVSREAGLPALTLGNFSTFSVWWR